MGETGSKDYFEAHAGEWDRLRASFFSEAVREAAFSRAALVAGRTAADVGAGTGFITEGLLAAGLRVVAVDESPAMLEELARKFPGDRIERRVGEAEEIPLPDGSVDYAFANMCLHHVAWPGAAVKEMARILRPGGKLVVTDLDTHEFEFLRREHHDRWLGFAREDVRRWFEEAGLGGVAVASVGERCTAQSREGAARASVGIFVAWGEKK